MKRPTDLRWAIVSSLIILIALVVIGVVRPPSNAPQELGDTTAVESTELETGRATTFPLRSEPRGRTRPIDDAFQPGVGEEDGAPIAF